MNEKRGNKPYYPPIGWIGFGLREKGYYDGGNDTWIENNNSRGEWCVVYYGVGNAQSSDNVKKITRLIIRSAFKEGFFQAHEYCSEQYHPGEKVGKGVYFTPYTKIEEKFVGISEIRGIQ